MKLHTVQYPPVPCYLDPDKQKYIPQQPMLEPSWPTFFPK